MKPRERRETGQVDLYRARLDQIINLEHELARLARTISWPFLETQLGSVYADAPGQPPLPTRLMAGLAILKHTYDLSDEALCARWIENPYFQYFCGEEFFCHRAPFDRSSLTRWRQRMGAERLTSLLQESLAVAVKTQAMQLQEVTKVVVDTTVQEKAAAFPTDAKLVNRARVRLVRLSKRHSIKLRQAYTRLGKRALIKHQRYAHARQFKRARKQLRRLKTQLGRVVRDVERRIADRPELNAALRPELFRAGRVLAQERRQRGRKIYSLHAPEVECIGKGKAHKPYEFGVKVSVATTVTPSKGGQFVLHTKALPGNPYDGHTLDTVIPDIERITGATISRVITDAGYRGHNAPAPYRWRVYTAGQKRRMTEEIRRQMKRRSAVEPVIGHMKGEHRMGRNHLTGSAGDAINAVLAAVGYNFRRLLAWLAELFALLAPFIASIALITHTLRASKNPQRA
jgi:transposase, IS5 family